MPTPWNKGGSLIELGTRFEEAVTNLLNRLTGTAPQQQQPIAPYKIEPQPLANDQK